jgi:hypothetical protein
MKRNLTAGLLGIILLLITGCSMNHPDWYNVTGTGIAPAGASVATSKIKAKRAAILDGQRQLLEAAKGIHISSETMVEDFMTKNDYIHSRVEGFIRTSEILDTRHFDDGTCEVDMRIDMNQVRDIVR